MIARDIVQGSYTNALDVHGFTCGNQLEYQSIIQRQVEDILKKGKFLEGGTDSEVT